MLQGAQGGLCLGLDVAAHELAGLHVEGRRAGDVDHPVRLRYEREWHAELANHAGKNRSFGDILRHAPSSVGCWTSLPRQEQGVTPLMAPFTPPPHRSWKVPLPGSCPERHYIVFVFHREDICIEIGDPLLTFL